MSKTNVGDFSRTLTVSVTSCGVYRGSDWYINHPSVPFWRVYLFLNHSGRIRKGKNVFPLRKGSAMLIAPFTSFELEASKRPTHVHIHAVVGYPFTLLRDQICPIPSPEQVYPGLEEHIERILLNPPGTGRLLGAVGMVSAFLQVLEERELPVTDPRIARLDALIREHPTRRFTNEDLAEQVDMSTSGFIRFFREKTGSTPARYGNRIRTEQIANLLENTEWRLERIAEACGFADRYHMSKVFKRVTGRSPAAWRKAVKEMGRVE